MDLQRSLPADSRELLSAISFLGDNGTPQQVSNDPLSQNQNQPVQRQERRDLWSSYYKDPNSFESDSFPSRMSIAIEYDLLKMSWTAFSDALQEKQSTSPVNKAEAFEWKENTTIDELRESVRSLANKLEQSHGKVRSYFDRFCSNLNSHSVILEILPDQSQYLSIFCGVVKILLKASDNYRQTLEGLSKALAEIGDVIHLSVQHAKLINTSEMREDVSQLYAGVFCFLREAMLWYTAKRLKRFGKSFNENFYDKFSGTLDKINKKAEQIHIRANIGHHAKTTDLVHTTRHLEEKLDRIMTTQEDHRRSLRELQMHRDSPFMSTLSYSQTATAEILGDTRLLLGTETISDCIVHKLTLLPVNQIAFPSQTSNVGLDEVSRALEPYIMSPLSHVDIVNSGPAYFENKLTLAIRDWTSASEFQFLRIGGPMETGSYSITSEIAESVVKTASDLNVPAVYLRHSSLPKGEEPSITSTLYSLIYQLAKINAQAGRPLSFSADRLQSLDGTIDTWDKALSLLSDLLTYAPSTLLVVIDGIERFEKLKSNEGYIASLIELLQNPSARQDDCGALRRSLKVLFTTVGPCASLNRFDEKALKNITISRQNSKRRPGEPRHGRSQIQLLISKKEG